jgi:hypothetical protein
MGRGEGMEQVGRDKRSVSAVVLDEELRGTPDVGVGYHGCGMPNPAA